ncbi:hypothetical protein SASPL_157596 [Salvia splendens]|uniref:Disease resistance R13L4/SHOC-2-like LRR domain-containing protein n=1 Tax=Salvia splendens TaxID=180675 RepID=A0A8X8VUR3_SALSN|nr:hypothetical protein SASPL_157596 [Salvia splendens]
MAYNLQYLITILQQILHPDQTHWTFDHNKPQLESLLEKAESLMQILEKSSHIQITNLESQIRDTVYKAEDIIESQMVHQMLSNPENLQQATQQLESMKLVEELEEKSASSSRSKSDLVGVDAFLLELKDRLTNMEKKDSMRRVSVQSSYQMEDVNASPQLTSLARSFICTEQTHWTFDHNKPQLESLLQKAESLMQILEKSSHTQIASFESQIRDTVFKTEDLIESQMVHQMLSHLESESLTFSTPDLHQVTQELDSAVVLMAEKRTSSSDLQQATQQLEPMKLVEELEENSAYSSRSKNDLVGVDAILLELKDSMHRVSVHSSSEIEDVCASPQLMSFARSFICTGKKIASPVFSMLRLVRVLDVMGIEYKEFPKEILQLINLRYLAFSCTSGLPIGISRLWNLQTLICRQGMMLSLPFEIWEMSELRRLRLRWKANETNYPNLQVLYVIDCKELEEIPCDIGDIPTLQTILVYKCGSSVVASAQDIHKLCSFVTGRPSARLKETSLQQDGEISADTNVSEEQQPVVAPVRREGDTVYKAEDIIESQMVHQMLSNPESESLTFSTPDLHQVTQELDSVLVFMAEKRVTSSDLQQLESMKLVEVEEKSVSSSRYKTGLVGVDTDLLQLKDRLTNTERKDSMRRVSVHSFSEIEEVCASPQLMSLARSFICTGKKIASPVFSMLRLVRVLDVMGIEYKEFPEEILQLINLRYLAFSCTSGLPIGISRLWNLQTLICKQVMMLSLPSEIWEMSELRHLRSETISKIGNGYKIRFVHTKLQTIFLVWITPSLIRSGFFEIIPNIIWLGIYYIHSPDIEVDLSHLHKLENLRCQSELDKVGSCFLIKLRFPYSIRKLTIVDCVLFRRFLTTLCALPNLEVLYICRCVFERDAQAEEEEWEVTEGDEFRSLQHLNLQLLNIVRWRAKETNFPKLRELHVVKCNELEEIPCDIGDIPTLQEIYIHECGTSVMASALQIQKVQQEEYDNYDLKVLIEY